MLMVENPRLIIFAFIELIILLTLLVVLGLLLFTYFIRRQYEVGINI
jgi:hypothetical protein